MTFLKKLSKIPFMNPEINERKIWFQLLENNSLGTKPETSKAFEAFEIFLMLGTDRTIEKASKAGGKSAAHFSKWAISYKWTERAESYDQWKNDLALQNHEKTLQQEAEIHSTEWIKNRSILRKEEYKTGMKLIDNGNKILDLIFENPMKPVVMKKNIKNTYELTGPKKAKNLTGFSENTIIGNQIELVDRAIKSIESGFRLCRNSIDLPVGTFNHNFGKLPTSAEDLMALSVEDRRRAMKQLDEDEKYLISILQSRGENVDDLMVSNAEN